MLSYKVKLNGSYINKDEVVWGERYLSPDLSFVSGVTSQDYHLEGLTKIEASMDGKIKSGFLLPSVIACAVY